MRKFAFILIALLAICTLSHSQVKKGSQKIQITYIANDGFLIDFGQRKILIDALFGPESLGFCEIPKRETIDSLTQAKGRYSNIDLVAVTHCHRDHFHAPYVREHLQNNPGASLISCEQTVDSLKNESIKSKYTSQIVEVTPDLWTSVDTAIGKIQVKVFRLRHSAYFMKDPHTGEKINKHEDIQNVGYLFDVHGLRIFHAGDASLMGRDEFKHFRLKEEQIDIAFLDRSFIAGNRPKQIQDDLSLLGAEHIILMHLREDRIPTVMQDIEMMDSIPFQLHVFQERMDSKSYIFESF